LTRIKVLSIHKLFIDYPTLVYKSQISIIPESYEQSDIVKTTTLLEDYSSWFMLKTNRKLFQLFSDFCLTISFFETIIIQISIKWKFFQKLINSLMFIIKFEDKNIFISTGNNFRLESLKHFLTFANEQLQNEISGGEM
jgi:hypothetical protein